MFCPYIFRHSFTLETYRHSLWWLTNLKSPSGLLERWVIKLQEYDVAVLYKFGEMHLDADCPSCDALPNEDNDSLLVDADTIAEIQAYDVAVSQQEDPNSVR